jgi:hypothetical protein
VRGSGDAGTLVTTSMPSIRCITCGASSSSPSCAVALDSITCCPRCAESFRESEEVPLSLSTLLGRVPTGADTLEPVGSTSSGAAVRWVILVARNQPDLLVHLETAFATDEKVEIVIDRRSDDSRNPPWLEERLRIHGAAVVRRPPC